MFTPSGKDDSKPLENKNFRSQIIGKLVGNKAYISKKIFEKPSLIE